VIAKRMRASVEAFGADIGIPITLSVGIVNVEADASAVHIISTADQRMYESKAAGPRAREPAEKTCAKPTSPTPASGSVLRCRRHSVR
jgi:GGDEF domain-containing protein